MKLPWASKYAPHVYRAYKADGTLLYIGMTSSLHTRLDNHRANSLWGRSVAEWEVIEFPTVAEAVAAEEAAIVAEQPRWNIYPKRLQRPSEDALVLCYPEDVTQPIAAAAAKRFDARYGDVEKLRLILGGADGTGESEPIGDALGPPPP